MISGINHLTLVTADLDRALAFYRDLLGCDVEYRWARGAYLRAGSLWLCLEHDPELRLEASGDDSHPAFDLTSGAFDALSARIREAGVSLWKQNSSEGPSLYILDPDGRKLELHVGTLDSRLAAIPGFAAERSAERA